MPNPTPPTPKLPPWVNRPPPTGQAKSLQNLQKGGIDQRRPCQARTAAGRPCRGPALRGQQACWRHWGGGLAS